MLLDTHVLLWLLADDDRLGDAARGLLTEGGPVLVSAASLWEIAIKVELGKLEVPADLPDRIEAAGVRWLPVTAAHAWAVRNMSGLPHRDPFDRLLLAQAGSEGLRLMTADATVLSASISPEVTLVDARS